MNDWIQRLINNNFADLAGLNITGEIPVKEQLINEVIADFLRAKHELLMKPAGPDLKPLLRLLQKATIRADSGIITIHFEIGA